MGTVALWFLAQAAWTVPPPAAAVTVGDTVELVRLVQVSQPAFDVVANPIEQSRIFESLRPPEVAIVAQRVSVRYWLAFFEPGDHAIEMPNLEVAFSGGRVEVIPGGTANVIVSSTLPAEMENVERRRPRAPVARRVTDLRPALLLGGIAILLVGLWGFRSRRVKPRPGWQVNKSISIEPNVHEWLKTGENRAVAAVAADNLRQVVARLEPNAHRALSVKEVLAVLVVERDEWPLDELEQVLTALELAAFSPVVREDLASLATGAHYLVDKIEEAEQLRSDLKDPEVA